MVLGVSTPEFKRHGAFAEYLAVPEHILYILPENVSYNQAALVEPAAVALHAINISPLVKTDVALVIGAGMVGMFVIRLLKLAGCKTVIAVDTQEDRLAKAKDFGADFTFTPDDPQLTKQVMSITENRGADIAFEVVGISETIRAAINLLRKAGTLVLIGNLSPTVELPLQAIVTRQLRLQGSCAINGEYPAVLDLISKGELDVTGILSAEAPLADGAMWFEKLYKKEKGLMKVILKP